MHQPILPADSDATLIGRVWRPGIGPAVVAIRGGDVVDITSKTTPTMREVTEAADAVDIARNAPGAAIGSVADLLANADETTRDNEKPYPIAPVDLHAIKASGVTFVQSLLERVIEEQARGDASRAAAKKPSRRRIGSEYESGSAIPGFSATITQAAARATRTASAHHIAG